ncbi:MAG: membrane protein insertase YidC [Gammaproteobacteria bacterium]|nr:membrane protein insertase YidC [Gammaproteobacteria bacterium]
MDSQRVLLYFSLVLTLFLIWSAWQRDYGPRPDPSPASQSTNQTRALPAGDMSNNRADVPQSPVVPENVGGIAEPRAATAGGRRIRVVTDVLDIEIDTEGGDIRRAALPTYPANADDPDEPFVLMHSDPALGVYIAQSGLVHDRTAHGGTGEHLAPTHHAIYTAARDEYRLRAGEDELRVPLTWQGPSGVLVRKVFTFHRRDFLIDVSHTVVNRSEQAWSGRQYRQLRHGPIRDEDKSMLLYTYTGAAYYDGHYEKVPFDDMQGEGLSREITGGWAAMLEHYFVSAWVPRANERNFYYTNVVREGGQPQYIIGLRSAALNVAPNASGTFNTRIFVGPKLQEHLDEIAQGLDLVVDYGIFTVLAKPLFWALEKIHDVVGNWGWAIVILTLLIKLAFYKLSETSYKSMARMRNVQPRMAALRERYANDKQKMNQALMELYKTEKINPLGGCLPILVQIPVFISLYWMLLESVEMRQADFMLWINDLSSRDPFFILPLLMGVTMFIQQKLNPAPLDPIQAKVMMVLPVVFTVFFAFFPSGLVLYWFVNNLLSIAQQWVITKRIERGVKPAEQD